MKKLLFVSFALFLAASLSPAAFAAPAGVEPAASSSSDVGNKICPVSGEAVSGKTFVEHEGKRYGLCCRACALKFKNNPEKYIAAMNSKEGSAHESM